MITCKIQWIDCNGRATPDNNIAIGYAVLRGERWPICAEHAVTMNVRSHHDARCKHYPDSSPGWTLEPLETP